MDDKNVSFGVRLKKEFVDEIDKIVKEIVEIKTNRSEFLEAITEAFFSSKFEHKEKAKEFIITKRKRESKVHSSS